MWTRRINVHSVFCLFVRICLDLTEKCTCHGRRCTCHGRRCTCRGRRCTCHGRRCTCRGRRCTCRGRRCTCDNARAVVGEDSPGPHRNMEADVCDRCVDVCDHVCDQCGLGVCPTQSRSRGGRDPARPSAARDAGHAAGLRTRWIELDSEEEPGHWGRGRDGRRKRLGLRVSARLGKPDPAASRGARAAPR
jgi:hypothetical protein